jgi:hypothetical protein
MFYLLGCVAWSFWPRPTIDLDQVHWATHGPVTLLAHFGLTAAGR